MDIYISNLPFTITDQQLTELFAPFGAVDSVNIVIDRRNRLKKGFGFVKMKDSKEALQAISQLNGTMLNDRKLQVQQSNSKESGGLGLSKNGQSYFKKSPKKFEKVIEYGDPKKNKPKSRPKRRGTGRGTTY